MMNGVVNGSLQETGFNERCTRPLSFFGLALSEGDDDLCFDNAVELVLTKPHMRGWLVRFGNAALDVVLDDDLGAVLELEVFQAQTVHDVRDVLLQNLVQTVLFLGESNAISV